VNKRATDGALQAAAQAETALSPEQRKYQQLVARIEAARATLQLWLDQVPVFAHEHNQRMRPLQTELAQVRVRVVRRLEQLLLAPGVNRTDRQTLQRALCELAAEVSASALLDEATAQEMQAVHDRHAPVSLEEDRLSEVADLKRMIEDITGVDLGKKGFASAEELRQHAQEKIRLAREAFAAAEEQHQAQRPPKRVSAKERQRLADEQTATASVREVYRKLASALHPDRASDEDDRMRRTALMQRVNQAYTAQDLMSLFALQLEIEQIDPEHLARASSERMRHYNRILTAQLDDLKGEIFAREEGFAMQFGIEPWRRLNPKKLGPLLKEDVAAIRGAIAMGERDLRRLEIPLEIKRWIQEARRAQADDDQGFMDIPF